MACLADNDNVHQPGYRPARQVGKKSCIAENVAILSLESESYLSCDRKSNARLCEAATVTGDSMCLQMTAIKGGSEGAGMFVRPWVQEYRGVMCSSVMLLRWTHSELIPLCSSRFLN